MPNLNELKLRISSVKSTQKITKAKQMVAAAKLRRAEERVREARPYADGMEAVLSNLAAAASGDTAPKLLSGTGADQTHLLIVATADKGLCGGFNSSIVRLARETIMRLESDGKSVKIFCVGKKGREQLQRLYGDRIVKSVDFQDIKTIGFAEAKAIADAVLAMFEAAEFDVAHLFFGKFKSVMTQEPTCQQIIPAEPPAPADETVAGASTSGGVAAPVSPAAAAEGALGGAIYIYEPDEAIILEQLLPRYVSVQIFRALLENGASEQAASMTAMDNATRNAGEMIEKLTLQFNRARQAQITTELIEIIAGAEAV